MARSSRHLPATSVTGAPPRRRHRPVVASGSPRRSWPPEASDNDGQPILLSLKLELPDRGDIVRLLEVPDGAL